MIIVRFYLVVLRVTLTLRILPRFSVKGTLKTDNLIFSIESIPMA